MTMARSLCEALHVAAARFADVRGWEIVADFGHPSAEYASAVEAAALYPALDRGLIEIAGTDRGPWLHTLVTNAARHLLPGQGIYTFATNVQGRVLMDFHVLARPDAFWLDIDRRQVAAALAHFDRHVITEDIQLRDRSDEFTHFVLIGPKIMDLVHTLGGPHVVDMPQIGSAEVDLAGRQAVLLRHDLGDLPGVELYLPAEVAYQVWLYLCAVGRSRGLRPIGRSTIRTLQIEVGIPTWGEEIDDNVLPAETLQLERAVSFNKGCYLGHEVIERMRSHHVLPRRLVGLQLAAEPAAVPLPLQMNGKTVGRLMSFCRSYALGAVVGLGYLTSTCAGAGNTVTAGVDPPLDAQVIDLPMR